MSRTYDTPILIVGAGPVGLALAGDLGWRGRHCTVVEQSDGSIYQPRQDLVGIRTMEFCRRWGLVAAVEATAYDRDYPQDNVYIAGSLAEGWEIGRYETPSMNASRPPPESPQKRERCPQNMFDPVLRSFAQSFASVDIRYRHRLVSCAPVEGGVVAEIERLERGDTIRIAAEYLVACDGASSGIRQRAGITMSGNPALTHTTNIIFRCAGFEALHDKKPGYRFIFVGPEGTWATIVAINGRDEWRMSVIRAGDGRTALGEDEVRAAIRRAVGADFEYEILSVMPWTRRELVADAFSRGRLFLAGDSAHAMSPTGGFGMNTGVGDAVDLSWKMTAIQQGWGGAALLASYSEERRPVAERNVREASGNLGRMLSPPAHPDLLDRTPEAAALRAKVGHDLAEAMQREWRTLGIHLGYFYDDSPICIPDGTPAPSRDPSVYAQTSRPGSRAPHVWRADGTSTLDLFGRGFVLLRLGAAAPDTSSIEEAASAAGLPLSVATVVEPDVVRAYQRALVLVRPDGHVAWRGDAPPVNAKAVIDRVRGAA
jgi:2-polyprenyl-6-methoxyphenol hydroxylase-like FAD-dependent oxidoreductase